MDPKFVRLERPDPIVCADSVLNVAFERRDPGAMQRFLADFGFLPVGTARSNDLFPGPRQRALPGFGDRILTRCPAWICFCGA